MISLKEMNEEAFESYMKISIKNYGDEKVKAGNWPLEGSYERSKNEFKKLLPDGLHSKDNYLYSIFENNSGKEVGMIWVSNIQGEIGKAFIYDFIINDDQRRKGFGKDTIEEISKLFYSKGFNTLRLHVFGHNNGAIDLYLKTGFRVTNMIMEKELHG
ncbi:MAG: GNAT family N-acetyltransferase [Thermoplasmataceae archaeon]